MRSCAPAGSAMQQPIDAFVRGQPADEQRARAGPELGSGA